VRVLVTGADGFIGRQMVAALRASGHQVLAGIRVAATRADGTDVVECDFINDLTPEHWRERLQGVDAVVNCVGILRERDDSSFESVHVKAPAALYQACTANGLRRVIQISALGNPQDDEFIASKHRGDAAPMPAT
jgi:uncharacterized protein YbjT (DUF2867 family)